MKSLRIVYAVLLDCQNAVGVPIERDFARIRGRVEDEGLSFLTIGLPNFEKGFTASLESGKCERASFPGFRFRRGVPEFLGGLFALIFDAEGTILANPDVNAVFFVRQICLLYKKLQMPCSAERVAKAIKGYTRTDDGLETDCGIDLNDLSRISAVLLGPALAGVDRRCYENTIVPRHGPGAVAEKLSANAKWNSPSWHSRLEAAFPFDSYRLATSDEAEREGVKFISPEHEPSVRIVTVPKTLKAPRVIAVEPTCMMYAQQALMAELYDSIEESYLQCIRFRDQTRNRDLALMSSKTQSHTTMDLSEASDRVRFDIVEAIMRPFPNLWEKLKACRSTTAILPNGTKHTIRKFASMGSAVCFPIEALVFTTLIVLAWERSHHSRISTATARRVVKLFQVYGDDLLMPVDWTHDVKVTLEAASLKVNSAKTFSTGKFRESCGLDAYDGCDVTPTYIRHMEPDNITDVNAIVAWVAASNSMHQKGMWLTADYMREAVERIVGPLPLSDAAPYLHLSTFQRVREHSKYHPTLFKPFIRAWKVENKYKSDSLDGYGALLKCLLHNGIEPMQEGHLDTSGRPVSSRLKRRWLAS